SPPVTTRGAGTRWNGPRPPHRPNTTSTACRRSGPSGRRGTCARWRHEGRAMRVEWKLFAGAGAFLVVTSTAYWFASYEDAGTTMLALGVLAVLMVAGWLFVQARKVGLRPEDRADARPEDGAGD